MSRFRPSGAVNADCGAGMFQRLVHDWSVERVREPGDDAPAYTPAQVAEKVKLFFHKHQINRHKSA